MPESAAKRVWDRENTKRIQLKLNNHTDADIIRQLEQQTSIQGYIKNLIRNDLKASKAGSKEQDDYS